MDSYEKRLRTFTNKNWFGKTKAYTPEKLAICGFYTEKRHTSMAVKCYYCKKVLEGWEDNEVPIIEHYIHKKSCILFRPNSIKNRKIFFNNDTAFEDFAKNNFVKYNILEDRLFIFCYKCGSQDLKHSCKLKKTWKFNPNETSEFFFANLISGRLSGMISEMMCDRIEMSDEVVEVLEPLVDRMENYDQSKTLEEFISSYCTSEYDLLKKKMEDDLNK